MAGGRAIPRFTPAIWRSYITRMSWLMSRCSAIEVFVPPSTPNRRYFKVFQPIETKVLGHYDTFQNQIRLSDKSCRRDKKNSSNSVFILWTGENIKFLFARIFCVFCTSTVAALLVIRLRKRFHNVGTCLAAPSLYGTAHHLRTFFGRPGTLSVRSKITPPLLFSSLHFRKFTVACFNRVC